MTDRYRGSFHSHNRRCAQEKPSRRAHHAALGEQGVQRRQEIQVHGGQGDEPHAPATGDPLLVRGNGAAFDRGGDSAQDRPQEGGSGLTGNDAKQTVVLTQLGSMSVAPLAWGR
jgi:hypothetical protein